MANGFAVTVSVRMPDAFQFSLASVTLAVDAASFAADGVGGDWLFAWLQNVAPEMAKRVVLIISRNERDRLAHTPLVGCIGFMTLKD